MKKIILTKEEFLDLFNRIAKSEFDYNENLPIDFFVNKKNKDNRGGIYKFIFIRDTFKNKYEVKSSGFAFTENMINTEIEEELVINVIKHELTHWDSFKNWKPTLSGWEKNIFSHGIGFKRHAKKFNISKEYMGKNTFDVKYFYYLLESLLNKITLRFGLCWVYEK